jgi:co-chaperonin GroES (HSP10)
MASIGSRLGSGIVVSGDARAVEAKSKREMTDLVERMYADTERWLQPLKPFILVRTLPRSTVTAGGVLMPEKQNKPNIEAVVLAVYKPYWEKVDKVSEDGKRFDISVFNECDIKVGDHIVMPHHVGLPDSFLDEREYRLIKEDDAVAVLHYREKGWLKEQLMQLVSQLEAGLGDSRYGLIAEMIQEKFDLVPKVIYSRTTSGR